MLNKNYTMAALRRGSSSSFVRHLLLLLTPCLLTANADADASTPARPVDQQRVLDASCRDWPGRPPD
ncbi:unnamed protein product, partial [Amoebophrya sp. A25]|eukprot:GSA25T00017407001.1